MSQLPVFLLQLKSFQRRIGLRRISRTFLPLVSIAIFFAPVSDVPRTAIFAPAVNPCLTHFGKISRTTVSSTVYAQPVPVSVYLPPCYESSTERLPVIYLLHGGNADETQWPDLRVQGEADALIAKSAQPFVVVMPGGDYQAGIDYNAFVLNDLLPSMDDQYQIRSDAAGRTIGGISLGGYWAMDIAFRHPDQFSAVGGYSPVVASASDDLVALARMAAGLDRLRIQVDVGDADALVAGARRLATTLEARGLDVSFTINPGGHNRPYWRSRTSDYLRFMLTTNLPSTTHPVGCHGGQ